jgi:hypothetical protein
MRDIKCGLLEIEELAEKWEYNLPKFVRIRIEMVCFKDSE